MTLIIVSCCITALITGVAVYYKVKPQAVQNQLQNEAIQQANKELNKEHYDLVSSVFRLQSKYDSLQENYNTLTLAITGAQDNLAKLHQNLAEAQQSAEQNVDNFYNAQMKSIKEKLQAVVALEADAAEKKRAAICQEINEFEQRANEEKLDIQRTLNKMKRAYIAAMDEVRRKQEMENKLDYYRIQISDEDKCEIQALMSIEHLLKNKRNLYMLIWTSYYSKAVNELAARVLGGKIVTGIYKLTNIETQQVYIGQSKDIRERWRSEIKNGLGIDCPGNNKLFPAMQKYGITNFTFELMEECPKEDLDEREAYWISYYDSYTYGYNSTRGNKVKEK